MPARPLGSPSPRSSLVREEPALGTNAWVRKTIALRAGQIGLTATEASEVARVALWYNQRIVVELNKKRSIDAELPAGTNRYLVPITLRMACEYRRHTVPFEQLLKLSGNPTTKTVENALRFYARCTRILAAHRNRSGSPSRAPSPPAPPRPSVTTLTPLVVIPPHEIQIQRRAPSESAAQGRSRNRTREPNTNNWTRRRVAEVCQLYGIPEGVKARALQVYESIVDYHTTRGHAPPGKRLQLSPRLNWSLVYTTIYVACRLEQYPKDLPDILGRNPPPGVMREVYRLYRFYKRELKLPARQVDVRTFIHSWIDGFYLSEVMQEHAAAGESEWLRHRATAIAHRVKGDVSLKNTSTKVIAAGALTTALAERNPPGNVGAFYRMVAGFLLMSEETIRFVVNRIAVIL